MPISMASKAGSSVSTAACILYHSLKLPEVRDEADLYHQYGQQ